MSLWSKLKNIDPNKLNPSNYIKLPYRYVPPCPCCGDNMTGFYIRSVSPKQDFSIQRESIKNAEITKLAAEIPKNNCFCLNCGFEWSAKIKTLWITQQEMNGERIARNTEAILKEYFSTEDEKRAGKKKEEIKNTFSGLTDVFSIIPRYSKKDRNLDNADTNNTTKENVQDEEFALSNRRL